MTAYVIVYILSPYINSIVSKISFDEYGKLLIFIFTMWSIIPFFTKQTDSGMFWTQLLWFFVMYIYGAFCRRFTVTIKKSRIALLASAFIFALLIVVCVIAKKGILLKVPGYLIWSNSIYSVIVTTCLFSLAEENDSFYNSTVNAIASLMLGVYLFHENQFISSFLWQKLFRISKSWGSLNLVWISIIAVAFVLVVGSLIEKLRKVISDTKMYHRFTIVVSNALLNLYHKLLSICRKEISVTNYEA